MRTPTKITIIVLSSISALIAICIGTFFLLISPNINILNAPNLNSAQLTSYSRTVKILDKNGDIIDNALYDNNKLYVKVDELHDYTKKAFIAIEDKRFYDHNGIDYRRIASAMVSNMKSMSFAEGASTITQQLIKNTHLSNAKTIKRKLNELRLAQQIEKLYTKDQILESYLNILYFGNGIYGLGTAGKVMFGVPASELSLAQSAALASIINNPTKYNPYKNEGNLTRRKELVLSQMLRQGFITENEYQEAKAETVVFNKNKQVQFVSGVIKEACKRLNCTEKELFIGNYTIKTQYDKTISDNAKKIINNFNLDCYMRILVLDNAVGGIVCDETNANDYINFRRSPASAIKPILSYAPALENGMTPLSQIYDEPTDFNGYSPNNYNSIFRGYQSLKDSLKYSSNVAAVKLLHENGIEYSKMIASKFGIHFDNDDNSLAIALGGMRYGVTLTELANAYRVFANSGVYSECSYISPIRRVNNTPFTNNKTYAIGDDTAYLITDMLQECAKSGTAKRLQRIDNIAAKTGTNGDENGNYDCYCIAYTPQYTFAVWLGAKNTAIPNNYTGATCADFIAKLIKNSDIKTQTPFEMPRSVGYYFVDGLELNSTHNVYLASPLLPKRYCIRTLLSNRNLPIRKAIDIIDFSDETLLHEFFNFDGLKAFKRASN